MFAASKVLLNCGLTHNVLPSSARAVCSSLTQLAANIQVPVYASNECDQHVQPSASDYQPCTPRQQWTGCSSGMSRHLLMIRQQSSQDPCSSMGVHGVGVASVRSSHTQALQHPNEVSKPAKYNPWTYTRFLNKDRPIKKRMGFLMQTLEEEQVRASLAAKQIPDFKAGDILEVRMLVPEAGRKEFMVKGLCIARYNKGIRSTFKLYNVYAESGGVVQHLPLHMPDLLNIRVVGSVPVRRNKLYYLLDPSGKYETYQYQYQVEPQAVGADKEAGKKAADSKGGAKKGGAAKKKK